MTASEILVGSASGWRSTTSGPPPRRLRRRALLDAPAEGRSLRPFVATMAPDAAYRAGFSRRAHEPVEPGDPTALPA